ncbi:nucleotidyl transferase AbiEii/AbiGii toxin family protein, partial [Morganella morganii]
VVQVENLTEIMADKLVSFPATTRYIRYRDMWDLVWLHQQGAEP